MRSVLRCFSDCPVWASAPPSPRLKLLNGTASPFTVTRSYYAARGSGTTVVFLHGGGDSGEHSFARQLDVFSEHHHIVAPDQVGQGRTPEVPGPLSYTAMMDDTAALLKFLNLKHVDIVGFSDGGILALMLAVRHPDLVRSLVISGVNIAPRGPATRGSRGAPGNTNPETEDNR